MLASEEASKSPTTTDFRSPTPRSPDKDESNSSFGGDFGVFRAFLRGDETAEVTRRYLLNKMEIADNKNMAVSVTSTRPKPRQGSVWFALARSLLLDLPLALLFASLLITWLIRQVHNEYYTPLFARARRTDEQLLEEYTYYERQCTEYDLSTRDLQQTYVQEGTSIPSAVDQMMTHGVAVVPSVLQPDTVKALRDYIVQKNSLISDAEAYPMSQGERRLSYGIDASEHVAVSNAIAEVAHHAVIRPLLASLLGDDNAASAEITSITAYPGAEDQVWHQDTKIDGNAIKFARTYSHSYSLFLPLQDTTALMGATDVCPGTHYCANDLSEMCDKTKLGLHLVGANDTFPAGAGALFNQHVWHRGGAHTDPTAPERIVFILSFLARPDFDRDPRQLSRGTYFHQKWFMWGHTWYDLLNPAIRMRPPFSLLRCLSLWKPAGASWGYDLITSGFMRFCNEQLEYEDFAERFLPRLDQFKFPLFLRGRHVPDVPQRITWTVFIRETIHKVHSFVVTVNVYVHASYFGLAALGTLGLWIFGKDGRCSGTGTIRRLVLGKALFRVAVTHVVLLVLLRFFLWDTIQASQWAKSISSGRALMRPFPPEEWVTHAAAATISSGRTTLPTRYDVLIGSRFDAEFLGAYEKWLDYHPGNALFRKVTARYASSYAAFKHTNPTFGSNVIQRVIREIRNSDGRFLQQDFRSGDWRLCTENEIFEFVAGELIALNSKAVATVLTSADRMIARFRFGPRRGTPMAAGSQLLLLHLKRKILFTTTPPVPPSRPALADSSPMLVDLRQRAQPLRVPNMAISARLGLLDRRRNTFATADSAQYAEIQVGSLVWYDYENEWFPGTVMDADENLEWFYIVFEDNSWEDGIHVSRLRKFTPIAQGDNVEGCFAESGLEDCYPGTVLRVMPGGFIDIAFDDGDIEYTVPPSKYFVPPYRYEGPFPY